LNLAVITLNQAISLPIDENSKINKEDLTNNRNAATFTKVLELTQLDMRENIKVYKERFGADDSANALKTSEQLVPSFLESGSVKESVKTDEMFVSEEKKNKPLSKIRSQIDSRLKKDLGRTARDSVQSELTEISRDSKDMKLFTATKKQMESSGRDTE
jgi:hypothetical protein